LRGYYLDPEGCIFFFSVRAYTDVLLSQRKILDSMNAMLGRSRNTGAGLKSFSGTRNLS
jgi:hypothetical protein